jgi:hypothetical protein
MLAIFSFFSSPFALSLSKRSDLHLDETSTKRFRQAQRERIGQTRNGDASVPRSEATHNFFPVTRHSVTSARH